MLGMVEDVAYGKDELNLAVDFGRRRRLADDEDGLGDVPRTSKVGAALVNNAFEKVHR